MQTINEDGKKKVPVIAVDEQELRSHVSEVVRQSVEETLNGLLEAEADALCQARRYERNAQRASTRAGHYERALQTKAGTVQLNVPKLRHVPFETAIIEREVGAVNWTRSLGRHKKPRGAFDIQIEMKVHRRVQKPLRPRCPVRGAHFSLPLLGRR